MIHELYEVSRWRHITNYQCKLCPFATVEGLQLMLAHIQAKHGRQAVEIVDDDVPGYEAEVVFYESVEDTEESE